MDNAVETAMEVIVEIICGVLVIGLLSYVVMGEKIIAILERML